MIDQAALKSYLAQIERNIASAPMDVLREVKRRQDIDKHNAMIDAKRAAKAGRK